MLNAFPATLRAVCLLVGGLLTVCLPTDMAAAQSPALSLQPGAHIAIIGNTLADRLQHFGWLEARLHVRFPEHRLVVRDLGFSGDTLRERPRSDNFGSPDEWLTRCRADVILAFFGYNEAYAGAAGLPQFRRELAEFITHTLQQQYNGQSAPQLVLCSPIAVEDHRTRHLPDGQAHNARLAMYTAAMQEVAQQHDVLFVDLLSPTRTHFQQAGQTAGAAPTDTTIAGDGPPLAAILSQEPAPSATSPLPLTLNGIHLTSAGNYLLARVIDEALFDQQQPNPQRLQAVRAAVLDKNLHWHNIYRATDGYSVFGGRSGLRFVDGQTNFEVMQRELQILDVMTQNRDRVIWAAAQGQSQQPDDSQLPEPLVVRTNKPGQLEGGRHRFLTGAESLQEMTVHNGMQIGLFASEERFPELINPVQSAVDAQGRLWVATWPTYPHWNPRQPMNDRLVILPDDDGDGTADRCITFADGLHNPTGFEFWNGGVLVVMAPDIFFLKDTDGDDVCDLRERIFHGLDSADTHHTANALVMGPNGRFYFSRGIFHAENFETPWGPTVRAGTGAAGVYEFDPLRFDIRFHFPIGPNPHGDVFDTWGHQFATDGTSGTGNYIGFPGRGAPRQLYTKRVRPVPAIALLDSPHFPESLQGNLLIANVIGFQGVTQYQLDYQGAEIHATEVEPIVYSTDPNFRPSDLEIGGDGALYILDWHNPLIGHMQHNLRDPSRDQAHGRIYRVTVTARPLLSPARLQGRPVAEVVRHLAAPMLSERYRARLELTGRDSHEVVAAVGNWLAELDAQQQTTPLLLTEALWIHQQHRLPNTALLTRVLSAAEPRARAAGLHVLREWYSLEERSRRNPTGWDGTAALDAEEWLVRAAADPAAEVRAAAIVAAAAVQGPRAAEVLFTAGALPTDVQIEFNLAEARKVINLPDYLRRELAAGRPLSAAAQAWATAHAGLDILLQMERTADVCRAILTREDASLEALQAALTRLAELQSTTPSDLLFRLIDELQAEAGRGSIASLSRLLSQQPTAELAQVRDRIAALAVQGGSAEARRVAYAAWISVDGHGQAAFAAAGRDPDRLRDVLAAIPLVSSATARMAVYDSLQPLLPELPGPADSAPLAAPGLQVDYFHPSPDNVALETLAQLQPRGTGVFTEVSLAAPQIAERDQFALRFTGRISIRTPGRYTFYLSSDDGSRLYLGEQLLINNDGLHGMSERQADSELQPGLYPLTVTYFDNGGGDGLQLHWSGPDFDRQPLPADRLSLPTAETLQESAIQVLHAIPGREAEKAGLLLQLIRGQQSLPAAVTALLQIPADNWPADQLQDLAETVLPVLSRVPPEQRNGPQAAELFQLLSAVAARLPAAAAQSLRHQTAALTVPLIPIGTVRERMIYDREIIAVQAGRPVELRLSNTDNMPHNLAVVRPGSLQEVGELAEATGRAPDAAQRQFVPDSPAILVSSRLLQPEQSQSMFFVAPTEPGIYPYVCTYPGHWRRMYGALYVVADLEDYARDPAAYVAQQQLVMRDPLLKYLGRNTDWTVDDLRGDVMHLHRRANQYAVGRQLFRAASCTGCHQLEMEGLAIGPDLTKLPPEYSTVDVLTHILDPSLKIDPKYRSSVLALRSGKVFTGLVLQESAAELQLLDNPAAPDKPLVIPISDIEERQVSPVSIMPKGVLNKLTREEILDLLAYVMAGGNPEHRMYANPDHAHEKH